MMSLLATSWATAQTSTLSGKCTDAKNGPLIGVAVILISQQDTTQKKYVITDTTGRFQFAGLARQAYQLRATYIGFDNLSQFITLTQDSTDLGTLLLIENAQNLQEVIVKAQIPPSQMKGDTLQMNADAFKVNPDATTEDLIKKMPGISVENGKVQAQGEDVQQILVDGKPFFGDDPAIALRNLPADVVDKVEIIDRLSDQAQLTGFNDGRTRKTINIVTRKNRRHGVFGRFSGGYGTNDTYSAGTNLNLFDGERRLTIIGMSNNVNQQNFTGGDILGTSTSGAGARGGNSGGGNIGQQAGINTTNSIGFNFSDDWGKKLAVRGSYFFNNTKNQNIRSIVRQYFLAENGNQFYRDNSRSNSNNANHRADLRLEYTINDKNSLILTPRINWQDNESVRNVMGITSIADSSVLNRTRSDYNTHSQGMSFGNNILFRHKFAKKGRSLSVNFGTDVSTNSSNSTQHSLNEYFTKGNSIQRIDQQTKSHSPSYQFSGNISYTEPINAKNLLQVSYRSSFRNSDSDRRTLRLDTLTQQFSRVDSLLSNTFANEYLTHAAAVNHNYHSEKINLITELSYQRADQISQQLFPRNNYIKATFGNLLPSVTLDYRFSRENRLRLSYQTNTQSPSVTQLQNVINNTNPLFLSAGNPDLQQSYSHSFSARYTLTRPLKSRSFFVSVGSDRTQHYIGNSTQISDGTVMLPNGQLVGQGVQLSQPVNLDGLWSFRSSLTYGTPIKVIKTNVNLSAGYSYNHSPSLINKKLNFSSSSTYSHGATLSSNISEKLDFTLSYSLNYNEVTNTIQSKLDNNYFYRTTSARVNWIFWRGIVLQSDISNQQYRGLAGSFNQQYTLWNAGVGKKIFKNQRGEVKVIIFDLLKQNTSISRSVSDTYLQDTQSLVLQRYFLVTFTYNLRQFKGGGGARPGEGRQGQGGNRQGVDGSRQGGNRSNGSAMPRQQQRNRQGF